MGRDLDGEDAGVELAGRGDGGGADGLEAGRDREGMARGAAPVACRAGVIPHRPLDLVVPEAQELAPEGHLLVAHRPRGGGQRLARQRRVVERLELVAVLVAELREEGPPALRAEAGAEQAERQRGVGPVEQDPGVSGGDGGGRRLGDPVAVAGLGEAGTGRGRPAGGAAVGRPAGLLGRGRLPGGHRGERPLGEVAREPLAQLDHEGRGLGLRGVAQRLRRREAGRESVR